MTYTAPKQPKKEKPGTKQEYKSFDKGFKLKVKLHIMQGSQDYFSFNYTLVDVEMSRVRVS